jgi:2-amino-4-hydroxy-6-hydroxymethyldihydropteridine diphosphokinase
MGDRAFYIKKAVRELEARGIQITKMSSVIETDPVGGPPQGKYLNAVAECATQLLPADLLITLQEIETSLGRVKTVVDGPRVIDLDILLYDQTKINKPNLIIPHPRLYSRDFVVSPLKEIAPHLFGEK